MAGVQTNIRLPEDIKDWLTAKAETDGRTKGEVLARIIRPLMEGHQITPFPRVSSPKPGGVTRIDLDGNEYHDPTSYIQK